MHYLCVTSLAIYPIHSCRMIADDVLHTEQRKGSREQIVKISRENK